MLSAEEIEDGLVLGYERQEFAVKGRGLRTQVPLITTVIAFSNTFMVRVSRAVMACVDEPDQAREQHGAGHATAASSKPLPVLHE